MSKYITSAKSTMYAVHSAQYSTFLLNLRKIGGRMALLPVIVFVLFLTVNNVKADDPPPPCNMDCLPQSPWNYATSQEFDYPGCIGCKVKFDYWWRDGACGVWKDLQMGPITFTMPCLSCSITMKAMIDFAVDKMILNNPITKPGRDSCDTFWRAINASCWRPLLTVDSVYVPCENSECCWSTLTMCTDSNDSLTYTIDETFPTPNLCFIHIGNCSYVCDETPEPSPMPSGLEENINIENGFSTLIYPNPGTDWFNIKFQSETEGQYTIEVFDASGILISIKDFVKVQDEIIIQLNMSGFSNGNYRYVIKHNDKPGISGSFNVVK